MVNSRIVVVLATSAMTIIVLFGVVPIIGSIIDDTYTVTDTSTTGWNTTVNINLDTPAESWIILQGLIVLVFLSVIIAIVIGAFRNMGSE